MIRLASISKSFPGRPAPVAALSDIDLHVPAGQIFGIIGSSGAGKSTLVRLINLLERPSSGDIFVDGERVTHARKAGLRALRRRIGMVFQHFNLLSARTVAENVAFPLELAGEHGRAVVGEKVRALIERVGLTEHTHKYPAQLSGGQKQRVGIARALACDPKVLLCDEATSALDPQTTRAVLDLLQELNRDLGVTIVVITHEMDVIRHACDRVAVLDHGRIVETGTVAEVFLHPRHAATRRLVREAEPAAAIDENAVATVPGRRLRVTLLGQDVRRPLLGSVARDHGVDYSILGGRVGHIRDRAYAQFTLSLSGRDVPGAAAALRAGGATVEDLGDEGDVAALRRLSPERLLHVV